MTDTQIKAFNSVKPHLGKMQLRVLEALRSKGPMTTEDIALSGAGRLTSVSSRLSELMALGLVSGDGRTVAPSTGRKVVLWAAT